MAKKPFKRKPKKEEKQSFSEEVSLRIIAGLEDGTAPWVKGWKAGSRQKFLPINVVSGNRYKGINVLALMTQGYSDHRWMTFKQAQDQGYYVRAGEKGTRIQYWSFTGYSDRTDESGNVVVDDKGKTVKDKITLENPFVRYAYVFNAQQVEGYPPLPPEPDEQIQVWDQSERAEAIIAASGARILFDQDDQAFYLPIQDRIHMPSKAQFQDTPSYYETMLHELGHWTGSKQRLGRDLSGTFGTPSYAKEELRAEIASMMLGETLDLGHNPDNHVSYIASWIKTLKEDHLEIFRAAADAEKIHNYIMAFDPSLAKEAQAKELEEDTEFELSL